MEEQDITREFLDAMIGVRKASKIPHFFSELSYSELAVFRAMRFLSGRLPAEGARQNERYQRAYSNFQARAFPGNQQAGG